MTVMEAMLSRVPVVTTNVGIVPEIIEPGVTGEIVPISDPKRLSAAILKAIAKNETGGYDLEVARQKVMTLTDPASKARILDQVFMGAAEGQNGCVDTFKR